MKVNTTVSIEYELKKQAKELDFNLTELLEGAIALEIEKRLGSGSKYQKLEKRKGELEETVDRLEGQISALRQKELEKEKAKNEALARKMKNTALIDLHQKYHSEDGRLMNACYKQLKEEKKLPKNLFDRLEAQITLYEKAKSDPKLYAKMVGK